MQILPPTGGGNNPWHVAVRENDSLLFEVLHFGTESDAMSKAKELVKLIEIGRMAIERCKQECAEYIAVYNRHVPNCPVCDAGYRYKDGEE